MEHISIETISNPNDQQLLLSVIEIIQELTGLDCDRQGRAFSASSSLSDDIELESIEFVILAEKLEHKFGAKVAFTHWLAGQELDEILQLTLGDIVRHLRTCLS